MDRQVYKCECGYVTHFAKALEAHCRFRHHKPLEEPKAEAPLMTKKEPAEPVPAEEPEKAVKTVKTRKPRTTKKAVKEQK